MKVLIKSQVHKLETAKSVDERRKRIDNREARGAYAAKYCCNM